MVGEKGRAKGEHLRSRRIGLQSLLIFLSGGALTSNAVRVASSGFLRDSPFLLLRRHLDAAVEVTKASTMETQRRLQSEDAVLHVHRALQIGGL